MSKLDPIEAQLRGMGDAGEHSAELARRFAEAAAASGDAEVAFATLDTPVGQTSVAATPRGIVSVGLPEPSARRFRRAARGADLAPGRRGSGQARRGAARALRVLRGRPPRVRPRPGLDARARRLLSQGPRRDGEARLRRGHDLRRDRAQRRQPARAPRRRHRPRRQPAADRRPLPPHRQGGEDPGNYGGGPELKRWLLELEGSLPA